ncbi:MAG: CopG family transcriptional regulator [Crenarchaeota archaeon]|nr:CopG family transcriptional regulator [Thermoproteota archaeon]
MSSLSEKVAVYISRDLYEKLRKLAEEGGFSDINEFVEFVLREVASASEVDMSKEDEEKVKERLRALGYI